jgi:hypothetical protein
MKTIRAMGVLLVVLAVAGIAPVQAAGPGPKFIKSLQVAKPVVHGNLTIFPLTASATLTARYLTFDRAIGQGIVTVQEKDGGEVNTVRVKNTGDRFVFGMAGEMITGAKQNRMLQRDVLLPPKSGWVDLSVYCVEHGRWHGSSASFGSKGQIAAGRVRGNAANHQSQSRVWEEVASNNADLGVKTETGRFDAVYDDEKVQRELTSYKKEIEDKVPRLAPNAVGVAVAVGNHLVCVDAFGSSKLFKKMWPRLLESYVVDAISQKPSGRTVAADVEDFLGDAAEASEVLQPSVGSGKLYRLEGDDATGSALVHGRDVIHADLFPSETETTPLRLDIRRGGLQR